MSQEGQSWSITLPGRPITQNSVYSQSRWTRAEAVAQARRDAAILWRHAGVPRPLFGALAITVTPTYQNRRSLPDVGACTPAAKAAIDALVDIGAIADDDPSHVVSLTYLAPRIGPDGPALTITAALEAPPCPRLPL